MIKKAIVAGMVALSLTTGVAQAARPCTQYDITGDMNKDSKFALVNIDAINGDSEQVEIGVVYRNHQYQWHYPNPAYSYHLGLAIVQIFPDGSPKVFYNNPVQLVIGNDNQYCMITTYVLNHKK